MMRHKKDGLETPHSGGTDGADIEMDGAGVRPILGRFDCAVIGTGLAGLASAIAMAESGLGVALVGAAVSDEALARDTRSTALFGGSIELLRHIGVWADIADGTAPLTGLRLIDDTGGLLRAPEVLFRAEEIGATSFGYNIENGSLLAALWRGVVAHPAIQRFETTAQAITFGADFASVSLGAAGRLEARLVVGADGANSICRAVAGVDTQVWSYPQVAIATRFSHSRPHDDITTELHRRAGPLTTVPLVGRASSLVWVETPEEAKRLAALDEAGFADELEGRLQGLLGSISRIGPRAVFPLSGVSAETLGRRRIALVGEAAHRLPPIGAQGLNLGMRDIAWLAELAGEALGLGGDPGSDSVLAAYTDARRGDVTSRALVTDALNRSLIAGLLPTDLVRSAGLLALDRIGWLRRFVMREGVAPGGRQPRLLTSTVARDQTV